MSKIHQWMYDHTDAKAFNGSPAKYKKFTIIITMLLMLWFYVGFNVVKFIGQGENWLGFWQLPLTLVIGGFFFQRYFYKSMMRLDAQFGKGSGWQLVEKTVKLPELKNKAH